MPVNAAWHRSHPLPKRATPAQRLEWHVAHVRHCACRPFSSAMRTRLEAQVAAARKPRPAARKSAPKPVLLSGGNPQVARADGNTAVQAYIAAMPGWKRRVGRRLDAIITRALPGVQKAVKWNSPFYGTEARGWFLSFHCFTRYVKVAFFQGASLRPLPPGTSRQAAARYLDIHEDDHIDDRQLTRWVKQASRLPGWVMGGKQR